MGAPAFICYFHFYFLDTDINTISKTLIMRITLYLLTFFLNILPSISKSQQLPPPIPSAGLRQEVPVLCFHHIRQDAARPNDLIISADAFQADMKMLYDSGFQTISPVQLLVYYTTGKTLPPKPFLITFDDGNADQWENSVEALDKYNFKALFFIMTITLGKDNYFTEEQIRLLSHWEHYIGCHTWDHQTVNSLKAKDFEWQIKKPKAYLESLTGLPVVAFAYPYGQWNEKIIPALKKYGIKMAFQLTDKSSERYPLYSIRRLMVSGKWTPAILLNKMDSIFNTQYQNGFLKHDPKVE